MKDKLSSLGYGHARGWYCGRKFLFEENAQSPSKKTIAVLGDQKEQTKVAQDLIQIWKALREPGLLT